MKMSLGVRIISLAIGYIISMIFLYYSFNWDELPIQFEFMGINITAYFLTFFIITFGLLAGSLITSALNGKWSFDA